MAARLRNQVSPEMAGLAAKALALRDSYEPSARVALFGEMAMHFRELVPFPDDAVEALSDEQYVRDVLFALYAGRSKKAAGF